MTKKRDQDLRDVMAEEGSRGRAKPVRAVNREQMRQIRRIAQLLDNPDCFRQDYVDVILNDFEIEEGTPLFQQYMKLWLQRRGA